jgi:hypothetical protein
MAGERAAATISAREGSPTEAHDRKPDSYQHPERFWVNYLMEANSEENARKLAWDLCLEQTVELPGTTQVVQDVMPFVVASIERIVPVVPNDRYRVSVAYPNDTAGDELTVRIQY